MKRAAAALASLALAPPVTVGWVGDITPGSRYGVPPRAGDVVFNHVRSQLKKPDVMIGNLEGTFSRGGRSKCGASDGGDCFSFQAPPTHAGSLRRAGFDVMNVANNHAFDFFASGQHQTLQALRQRKVAWTGRPGQITIMRAQSTRVAVLGFAPYAWASNLLNIRAAQQLVRRAVREADVVVVCMHAGAEGIGALHVPRGHEFAGWHNFGMGGPLSLSGILTVQLNDRGETVAAHVAPVRLEAPGIPMPDRSRASLRLMNTLSRADFGKHAALINGAGQIRR